MLKPTTGFRFVTAVAVRTAIVVCFLWLPDGHLREYLYPVDLSAWPVTEGLQMTSVALFSHMLELTAEHEWLSQRAVPLSTEMALVLPAAG
jgi:hypothetical protein